MDTLAWEIIICCEFESSDVKVILSKEFNRKPYINMDSKMDMIWEKACFENKRLFNASKFRLANVEQNDTKIVTVSVGLTDYKETFCTNFSDICTEAFKFGEFNYKDKHACFGNAIGVASIVVSNDGFIVLIRRSNWVGEAKGLLDTPGGHAEPREMLSRLNIEDIFAARGEDVVNEIFYSMVREVRDEINIPEPCLSWPVCLGIFRNIELGGKPGFIFYIKCNLSRDEIETLYNKGGLETDESTEILFKSSKEIASYSDKEFGAFIHNMAPGGQAAFHMFRKLRCQLKEK